MSADVKGDAFYQTVDTKPGAGQYFTPRPSCSA